MRYWKLIDSNRVIAVNVFMNPLRWIEITKEEFDNIKSLVLTIEEKKEIEFKSNNATCKCGHPKNNHSRFIDCLFIGCQSCKCSKFEWHE